MVVERGEAEWCFGLMIPAPPPQGGAAPVRVGARRQRRCGRLSLAPLAALVAALLLPGASDAGALARPAPGRRCAARRALVPAAAALRGGGPGSSGDDDSDDRTVRKTVERIFRENAPEDVAEATEYVYKRLRTRAAANAGRCDVKVGAGEVEVRFPDDEPAQGELREGAGRVPPPVERMRQELHEQLQHEDALGQQFFDAMLQRNFTRAHALLDEGADPDWRHPHHHLNTALHRVAAAGDLDGVRYLLDNGASVHVLNRFGDSALFASAGGAGMEPLPGVCKDEWSASWKGGEKPSLEVLCVRGWWWWALAPLLRV